MNKHKIEWAGENTSVSPAFRRQGGGTGAWGTGGDQVVDHGYHCTACGAKGETREEFFQQDCQPVKG